METNGGRWNILETTVSYNARARLTPTLTHVVAYELATSGAEDDAMSVGLIEAHPRKRRNQYGVLTNMHHGLHNVFSY